ncbi:MAG TPA: tol-pal system protein YbgF [Nevskiales bacterium]|nr:tol-pal system protein YbgF [Nevskiales bacterium]
MRRVAGLLLISAALWSAGATAASGSVEMRLRALESRLPDADRLAALEKAVNSQGAGVLAAEMEQLKAEIRELRGQIEQLAHQVQKQQEGQRQLYGDLDRRLQALEARAAAPVVLPPAPPASAPAAAGEAAAAGPADAPAPPPASPLAATEQSEYLAAFELLQQGRTVEAIPALQAFLAKYPNGAYTANALYWLAEAHYVSKNYPQALAEFQKLVDQHPGSNKFSGALLKIGYIHYEMRNYTEARAVLERVKSSFPGSNVGALATERLERMRKEGV